MFSNYTLLHPLFLLTPLIYWLVKKLISNRLRVVEFSNIKLLKSVNSKSDKSIILEYLIIVLLSIALATPIKLEQKIQKNILGHTISIILDASDSMSEQNRFKKAKEVIKNFFINRNSDEIALTLFADYTYIASPFTYDKKELLKLLNYIKIGIAGGRNTALYEATYLSLSMFKKSHKSRVAILLSDGINSVNSVGADSVIKRAKELNVKFFTIALGKEGDVDVNFLKALANATNGKFFISSKTKNLSKIYKEIDNLTKNKIQSKVITSYNYLHKIFIYTAIALILLYMLLFNSKKVLILATITLLALITFIPNSSNTKTDNKTINKSFSIALDLSDFMMANDIYPNRYKFEKTKAIELLKHLKGEKVDILAFANSAYLITPKSANYKNLIYAIKHINRDIIKTNKSNLMALLKSFKELNSKKTLIIFTSGGDKKDFTDEVNYIKREKINVIIYAIGSKRGGVIKLKNGYLTNSSGEIVISKLNKKLKSLANSTKGRYIEATSSSDYKKILNILSKDNKLDYIKATSTLNIYFLLTVAILIFLFATLYKGELWKS